MIKQTSKRLTYLRLEKEERRQAKRGEKERVIKTRWKLQFLKSSRAYVFELIGGNFQFYTKREKEFLRFEKEIPRFENLKETHIKN